MTGFPIGCEVSVTSGAHAGHQGVVVCYHKGALGVLSVSAQGMLVVLPEEARRVD